MSTTTYPITARRRLEKAEKARWYRRPERTGTDLLKPDAHHVLVYRINGDYVLDSDRMGGADERVVQATHVSLVDMRRNAPVVVRLEIPSKDAASFEVQVTFTCTVTDAIAVVRGGVDAGQALWSHLKAHNRIFELGLDFPLSEINEVRRVVSAQVKAYLTIRPPTVPGMTVSIASVEMTSPEVLADFEKTTRVKDYEVRLAELELAHQRRLAAGRQLNEHELANGQQEHEAQLNGRVRHSVRNEAIAQSDHEVLLDGRVQQHKRDEAGADAEHAQMLAGNRSRFARSEFALDMETIGNDPRRALMAAFADGRIEARALSEQLRQLDDQDRLAQIEQAQRDREERLQLRAADREDRHLEQEQKQKRKEREHAERLRALDQARDDRKNQEEREREDRLEHERNERVDRIRQETADREDRQRREDADRLAEQQERQSQLELLKTMTAQGHFNNSDMQGDRLLAKVMNLPQPEVAGAEKPSLPTGAAASASADDEGEDEDEQDQGLREEDV
jgi:hypothetical protein